MRGIIVFRGEDTNRGQEFPQPRAGVARVGVVAATGSVQTETGVPNRASRTNSSTEVTNRRTGGTRSIAATDGKS